MPAVSVAQRRFLAIAEHDPKFAAAHDVHMSKKQFRDFTKTKEAGLPEHVKPKKKSKYRKAARMLA